MSAAVLEHLSEHYEKFLWLIGSLPHFDNICFKDESVISNLIGCDLEQSANCDKIMKLAAECNQNYVTGNRTNLLFVQTCIEHALNLEHQKTCSEVQK